ncbi:MAG: ankyrin repeat domain-containing protein [Rickettsiales bacterium]|nr:ankyrin repeat domain-containing protein [Rickettsiales bacterium]
MRSKASLLITIVLSLSAPRTVLAQDSQLPMIPPPPLPELTQEAPAMTRVSDRPSDEMDFMTQPQAPATFEPLPSAPTPSENAAAPAMPDDAPPALPAAPGEVMDQFFSTSTVMPDSPAAPSTEVAGPPIPTAMETPKPRTVRRYVAPAFTLQKKRQISFHSVRLPETLYRASYDRHNRHLPVLRSETDVQRDLAQAVARGSLNDMRALVASGADIHAGSERGENYVVIAARSGQTDALRWLLQSGASAQATDLQGNTALHYATARNQPVMMNLLRRYGA